MITRKLSGFTTGLAKIGLHPTVKRKIDGTYVKITPNSERAWHPDGTRMSVETCRGGFFAKSVKKGKVYDKKGNLIERSTKRTY